MTVAELITALATFPPTYRVAIEVHEDGLGEDCLNDPDVALADRATCDFRRAALFVTSERLVTASSIE